MSLNLKPSEYSLRLRYPDDVQAKIPIKLCPRCMKSYPYTIEYFAGDRSKSSGLKSHCRNCTRIANRKYHYTTNKYKRPKESTQVTNCDFLFFKD
jgi:hypothetical protein